MKRWEREAIMARLRLIERRLVALERDSHPRQPVASGEWVEHLVRANDLIDGYDGAHPAGPTRCGYQWWKRPFVDRHQCLLDVGHVGPHRCFIAGCDATTPDESLPARPCHERQRMCGCKLPADHGGEHACPCGRIWSVTHPTSERNPTDG